MPYLFGLLAQSSEYSRAPLQQVLRLIIISHLSAPQTCLFKKEMKLSHHPLTAHAPFQTFRFRGKRREKKKSERRFGKQEDRRRKRK